MTENDIPGNDIPGNDTPSTGIAGDSGAIDEIPHAESPGSGFKLPPLLAVLLRQAKAESLANRGPDSLLGAWADFETEGKKT